MTIAVCCLTPEGVILGADSTSSIFNEHGAHYFNFNQKVFEVGEDSTLGFVTWGMGDIAGVSHRQIIAEVADQFSNQAPSDLHDAFNQLSDKFWHYYQANPLYQDFKILQLKAPFGSHVGGSSQHPNIRTQDEENTYSFIAQNLNLGFCLGGYVMPDRTPMAIFIDFDVTMNAKPQGQLIGINSVIWKGVPNLFQRLIKGWDANLRNDLLSSGLWAGTEADLDAILGMQTLAHQVMPIRDAIDYVYTCIHSTIKAMKFSSLPQVCGGPIEIAVVTSDRNFRWVTHKSWDAAITDGEC